MRKLFSTNGRMGRASYFKHTMLLGFIGYFFDFLPNYIDHIIISIISLCSAIVALIVFICSIIKRLHDMNRSGWDCILLVVPLYNVYLALVLLFKRGDDGPNQYGDAPLVEISDLIN